MILTANGIQRPLLMDVRTPEEANTLVQEGLLHDYELKNSKLFHSECNMTQYNKCYTYSQILMTCRKPQIYVNCTKKHSTASLPIADNPRTHFCCKCKGKNQTCDKVCPVKKVQAEQVITAYAK
jgi:hypothetical protein